MCRNKSPLIQHLFVQDGHCAAAGEQLLYLPFIEPDAGVYLHRVGQRDGDSER